MRNAKRCQSSADGAQAMGIHRLPHGAQQPFYHVLVDERDRPGTHTTYVAQVRAFFIH